MRAMLAALLVPLLLPWCSPDNRSNGGLMMHIRTFAMLIGLALMAPLAAAPAGAQGSPEQRAACEGDAMRLCGQFVPDVARITACMHSKRRHLSPRCRAVFKSSPKKLKRG
jgi:hypothetical protein